MTPVAEDGQVFLALAATTLVGEMVDLKPKIISTRDTEVVGASQGVAA